MTTNLDAGEIDSDDKGHKDVRVAQILPILPIASLFLSCLE
jgi:hypothetical protein